MTAQTRLSAKGQIVIPRDVRERLRWQPGMRFDVVERGSSVVLRPLPDDRPFAPTTLADLSRLPRAEGRRRTIDEISGLEDAALATLLEADDQRE